MSAGRLTLFEALERALHSEHRGMERLSYAETTVTVRIDGGEAATLLLDRRPCEVVEAEEAEVEILLTPEQGAAFAAGELAMTAATVSERVRTRGPIRKYLTVDPILRPILAELAASERDDTEIRGDGFTDGPIDKDLLAIEVCGLHKSFGRNVVLAGLDLRIPEGAISVVLGPSGTGKSVLLQHVIGIMRPEAGDVLIRGRSLKQMSRAEILDLRRGIGVMFQDGALFSAMNVYDNVAFPLRQHTDMNDEEVREIVADHLDSVGLGDAGDRMPNELSGGMRKRAGLARALVLNPGIILCDEPDSGLDPVRTALLGDLLVEQHAEYGGTMIVVTHNVMLARRIADHMSIIWRGKVLESGMAHQILNSPTPFVQQFLAGRAEGPLGMDA